MPCSSHRVRSPARAGTGAAELLGVSDPAFLERMGQALADLGCDGVAEAIYGKDVFDARTGRLYWTPDPFGTQGTNEGYPGFSIGAACLDTRPP